jgi:hypothetical protein
VTFSLIFLSAKDTASKEEHRGTDTADRCDCMAITGLHICQPPVVIAIVSQTHVPIPRFPMTRGAKPEQRDPSTNGGYGIKECWFHALNSVLWADSLRLGKPKNNPIARLLDFARPDDKAALLNRGEDDTPLSGIKNDHPNNASSHRINIGDAVLAEPGRNEQSGLKAGLLRPICIAAPGLDQDGHISGASGIRLSNLFKIFRSIHG